MKAKCNCGEAYRCSRCGGCFACAHKAVEHKHASALVAWQCPDGVKTWAYLWRGPEAWHVV